MVRQPNEIVLERSRVLEIRKQFFDYIIASLSKAALAPDKAMGQAETWSPFVNISSNNPSMGTLIIDFSISEDEVHSYSLFQVGPVLRIGVLIPIWMEKATIAQHQDITEFWRWKDMPAPIKVMDREPKKLVEWTLYDENLYASYIHQESVILGLRHLHFRLTRDLFKKASTNIDRKII